MTSIPRNTAWLGVLTLSATALLPACGGGDDTTTGSGGSTATTEGTGATGGGGAGGSGATGGAGGSGATGGAGGGATGKSDGSPCTLADECASGYCLTQADNGWPYGYCTGACNSLVECSPGSVCVQVNNDPFCLLGCDLSAGTGCGPGYSCSNLSNGKGVCFIKCTKDAECTGYGVCDVSVGFCVVPEDCTTPGDEDGNGLSDCEDYTCLETCQPQLDAACGAGEAFTASAAAPVIKTGDNSSGGSLFAGVCSGSGNHEKLYQVAIPAATDGILDLSLVSDADLALYVRKTCAVASDSACTDALDGGPLPEVVDVAVAKGTTVYVFVDGSSYNGATGNGGPYTLTSLLIVPQTEIEPNDDQATATPVTTASLPAILQGALDQPVNNDDWYLVDTSALVGNKTITAETIGAGGDQCGPLGDIDTYLEIVAENGTVIDPANPADPGANEDIATFANWCSLGEAPDSPPGKYYIHVKTSSFCTPDPMGPDCAFKYGVKIQIK